MLLIRHEVVRDAYPLDDQNAVFLFHLSNHFGRELTSARRDPARLQRATKGAGESPPGGGDHVIQRRRILLSNVGSVMAGNVPVNPKVDGTVMGGEPGMSVRALDPIDANVRSINDFAHANSRLRLIRRRMVAAALLDWSFEWRRASGEVSHRSIQRVSCRT